MKTFTFYSACLLLFLLKFAFSTPSQPVTLTKKQYNGDQVLRVVPSTVEQQRWLRNLFVNANPEVYDFWTEPSRLNAPVDVHVNKNALATFYDELDARKIDYNVTVEDVQGLINSVSNTPHVGGGSNVTNQTAPSGDQNPGQKSILTGNTNNVLRATAQAASIVGTFPRYDAIVSYLRSLCSTYSNIASCGTVGTSFEGRSITYIKLATSSTASKKEIFIEGGVHAREWLGPATVIYIINRFVTTYTSDATAKMMLDKYNFVFVPVVNPDGYEYSQVTNRMWRKTRSIRSGSSCYGVDPNRNYNSWWGTSGSSREPCADTYQGPSPFSEPEIKAMSLFLTARANKTLAFFTLHTYAKMWLVPYGDRYNHYPADYTEVLRVAKIGGKALMAVNRQTWQVGNSADVYGPASGAGDDYSKMIGIKYVQTLELRGSNFIVATSEIDPSGREIWAGITAAVNAMLSTTTSASASRRLVQVPVDEEPED